MSPAKPKKKSGKKQPKKLYMAMGAIAFALFMYWGFQPMKGTINYGICKVFIELSLTYPDEIRYMTLLERPYDVRVEYVLMNEFGEYESRTTQCVFRDDPARGLVLAEVITNRQKAPKEKVEMFNLTIPAILANPPSLVAPLPLGDDLMKLWRGYE